MAALWETVSSAPYAVWNTAKYYAQTSYYLALAYGKVRAAMQPYISTKFNVNQIDDEHHVFIGDIASAYNREEMKKLGITHVVTAVLGVGPKWPKDFIYMNVPVRDVESENIQAFLPQTTKFINDAVDAGGKVLVHCICGVSRSATIVAAWVMHRKGSTVEDTIVQLQQHRNCVDPNPAFRKQLLDYAQNE